MIFPLIGGYYIITRLEKYAYINQRLGDQAILFNSILMGIPLLIISLSLSGLFTIFFEDEVKLLKGFFPLKEKYVGTCFLSFILAVGGTFIWNKFIKESRAIATAVQRIGNELELLFAISVSDSQLIQITLNNDKVYVGWVEIIPKPNETQFVKIIPLLSGYRDDKKELKLMTDYSRVYADYIQRGRIRDIKELEMNLVVRVSEIVTASKFDFEIWEQFERNRLTPTMP